MISRIGRRAVILASFLAVSLLSSSAFAYDKKTSYALSRCIMGGYYEKLGKVDDAIAEYTRALKTERQAAYLHLCLASAYLKKNDLQKATEELMASSRLDPDAPEPHAVLALLYYTQNKTEEAGREYGKALENASRLDPKNISLYKSLGALYVDRKDYAAAERTYRLIIDLAPSDPEGYFFLANVCDEQGKRDQAIAWLRKTLEVAPDYDQALNYLGYVFADGNTNLDEARALIDRALELQPDNGAYLDSRGWLLFRLGKYRDAVAVLEKAAGTLQDPVIYDHLGDTYTKLNDLEKARASWERSLELDPGQDGVRAKLESAKKTAAQEKMTK